MEKSLKKDEKEVILIIMVVLMLFKKSFNYHATYAEDKYGLIKTVISIVKRGFWLLLFKAMPMDNLYHPDGITIEI